MIQEYITLVADNSDALAGTQLDPLPNDLEAVVVYAASSQADTIMTLQTTEEPVAREILLPQRTNGVVLLSDDPGFLIEPDGATKLTIAIDIVTGATVNIVVQAD